MVVADFVILGIVIFSAVVGLIRGLLKEALSLATWIVAVWASLNFAHELAPFFAERIESPVMRLLVGGVIIFVVVLVVGGVLNYLISVAVRSTGLTGTDRVLGVIFGAARGGVIVALLLAFLAGILPLREESWWSESKLIPYHEDIVAWVRNLLPEELAQYLETEPAETEPDAGKPEG